ncbi:AAA domain-containing protein [Pontibacter harenae]|uniref:AAA domain-containing protein n=1 Tax=Pontibacter harenae TaxID=2894083 RepID=UPI001E499402|nr:AAA domain-containing protein [Pontibacter harenae]MCC9165982.1 AAA domain-containing protein [Pontibacter harenae]
MKSILKNYRRRLLNLSSSNRALLLLRLSKEWHLDVEELDFLIHDPAFSIVQQLIAGKRRIPVSPYADSRYAPVAPVSRRLRNIRRKTEMVFEERGTRELYLGWPFVYGKFSDGTAVRSPLLFFPVQLQINGRQEWELAPDETQPPHFNQSFLLAYAHYMGTPLAEQLLELDLSTLSSHSLEFRTQVYELMKEHQLAVHVGREFFADKVKPFRDYKKAEFEETLKPGQLHLEQEAVLGIYPQTASYLLADFDELLERGELQEMEDLFSFTKASINHAVQAQQTFTAFAMDASQEAALQQVKQGKSLVVQGPPGTGKSQLICNLVSDFTARGKKVLVVSQKRAALDVVHQRLASKGLNSFAAIVHDMNADRKAVFEQIRQQIDQLDEYKKQNLALNSIYTDRTFLEASRGINRCMQQLSAFKQALFDTSRCGWSAKELYLRSSLQEPHLQLANYKNFTAATVADFLPRLRYYLHSAAVFEQDDFVLKERRSFKNYGWPQRQELEQIIHELPEKYKELQRSISKLSGYTFSLDDLPNFRSALSTIAEAQELLQEEEVLPVLHQLQQEQVKPKDLQEQVKALQELYLVSPAPDAAIPVTNLAAVKAAVATYEQQRGNLIKSLGWTFSPKKKILEEALAKYNLHELNDTNIGKLQQRLELRYKAEELISIINSHISFNLNIEDQPTPMLQKLKVVELALQTQKLLLKLQKEKVLHKKFLPETDLLEQLEALRYCVDSLSKDNSKWLQRLPETQVQKLLDDEAHGQKLLHALQEHFEPLVAHDALVHSFSTAEKEVADQLLAQGIASADEVEKLFLNSLYLAWIYELEAQNPELRMPSSGELERVEAELQGHLQQKQQLSQEIVLSKLREQTYSHLETNRLGNVVTYRRLHAQVSKKRSLYPLRKLFSLFAAELLDLVPCWLASPETVSAVLPLERCFDLVIFDEASQCFAETGIPSMLRGQQVVVAGDAQQLKPSDLYRTRWTADEEDEVEELSAESLLQLCGLYLPQTVLMQHYRSRYPELIAFSNHHFYREKLELIPDLQDVNAGKPAIQYVQVRGLWQENVNVPEAEKVVQLVLELLKAGQQDVGVITFNYNQQMLVQDLLEDAAQQKNIELPNSVLVKNIENMQGDEKEVIILSVGYAPDSRGKLTMQFGSLNQAGGENRLNVAITRAKQQVFVMSSIKSEQLQVENTLHQGPKLLKLYLQYAQQVSQDMFQYQPKREAMPTQVPLLKEQLEQEINLLQQQVPFADLTLVQGQQYKGVVLTDDDLYYSHLSVRHSHADLPQLLRQRNWPYQKVYTRQFWEDKQRVLQRLDVER